jgi:ribosomal protein S18 acetylase RimI-like enzyme
MDALIVTRYTTNMTPSEFRASERICAVCFPDRSFDASSFDLIHFAMIHGNYIGMVSLNHVDHKNSIASALCVLPQYREKGIGSHLMTYAMRNTMRRVLLYVDKNTDTTHQLHNFFQNRGMKSLTQQDVRTLPVTFNPTLEYLFSNK